MRDSRAGRRALLVGGGLALAVLVAGGVAYATIPSNGVITGCYTKSGGTLRVIDANVTNCRPSETLLSWNVAGVPGQDGADGEDGADGQDGVSGYELVSEDEAFGSTTTSAFGTVSVNCPAGKKVLGGGSTFVGPAGTPVSYGSNAITSSYPDSDGTGWNAGYDAPTIDPEYVTAVRVFATCAAMG